MQLGKYELIRKLAAGGMAEVFLSRAAGPLGFQKTLVVKRILPHLAEESQFTAMFLSEAKLAAQLNHSNVVQIFDFGESDGTYYIAMEYIDGPNLRVLARKVIAAGELVPLTLAAKVISFACEGLAYAHELHDAETGQPLNLVHRDISPDNILLSRTGGVKVADFGIAKAANQLHHTTTGALKGKLSYMSPEHLRGKPLDARADVFALGVVLYELVTGKKPFDGDTDASIMQAILFEPALPAASLRPELPAELLRILDKALAKDREVRYQSCRDLQLALERFLMGSGEPVGAFQIARFIAQYVPSPTTPSASGARPIVAPTPESPRVEPELLVPKRARPQEPTATRSELVPTEQTIPVGTASEPTKPATGVTLEDEPLPSFRSRTPKVVVGVLALAALVAGVGLLKVQRVGELHAAGEGTHGPEEIAPMPRPTIPPPAATPTPEPHAPPGPTLPAPKPDGSGGGANDPVTPAPAPRPPQPGKRQTPNPGRSSKGSPTIDPKHLPPEVEPAPAPIPKHQEEGVELTIRGGPGDVMVILDGKPCGFAPYHKHVSEGDHEIEFIDAESHKSITVHHVVKAGQENLVKHNFAQ